MAVSVHDKTQYMNGSEQLVHNRLEVLLPDGVLIYSLHEINGEELDFCLLAPQQGLVVIEVKGWRETDNLRVAPGNRITFTTMDGRELEYPSPKKQSRRYRFNLLNRIRDLFDRSPLVIDMVCYPYLSESYYYEKGLDVVSEPEWTITRDDLSSAKALREKIARAIWLGRQWARDPLDSDLVQQVRSIFEPSSSRDSTPGPALQTDIWEYSPTPDSPDHVTASEGSVSLDEEDCFNIPVYSLLQVFGPENPRVDLAVNELLRLHSEGTKVTLVVATEDQFRLARDRYAAWLGTRGMCLSGGNLKLAGPSNGSPLGNADSPWYIGGFNFALVRVRDARGLPPALYDFRIADGQGPAPLGDLRLLDRYSDFNLDQYLIEHVDVNRNIVIKAGAGTGKTHSMIARVMYLCFARRYSPEGLIRSLTMITFTNDAADNMKRRLKQAFANYYLLTRKHIFFRFCEAIGEMQISTIHSLAKRIIQTAGTHIGYGRELAITAGTYELHDTMDTVLGELLSKPVASGGTMADEVGLPVYQLRRRLRFFQQQLQNRSVNPSNLVYRCFEAAPEAVDFGESHSPKSRPLHEILYETLTGASAKYREQLRQENRVHLGDLMILLEELARSQGVDLGGQRPDYVFIDEFQDTDDVQIDAVKHFQARLGFRLFVVGDVKQCIYRFRGAQVDAFSRLRDGYQPHEWADVTISKNYRTDACLLDEFHRRFSGWNTLIPYRSPEDRLTSSLGLEESYGPKYKGVLINAPQNNWALQNSEIEKALLQELDEQEQRIRLMMAEGKSLKIEDRTIAILVRENREVELVRQIARRNKRLIQISTGGDLFQSDPALDLLQLVSALKHHQSPIHLVGLLSSNFAGTEVDLEPVWQNRGKRYELAAHFIQCINEHLAARRDQDTVAPLTWEEIVRRLRVRPVLNVVREIISLLAPWERYAERVPRNKPAWARYYYANLELVLEHMVYRGNADYWTVNSLYDYLRMMTVTGQQVPSAEVRTRAPDTDVPVICSTVHKAKGLEWGAVIVPYTSRQIERLSRKADVHVTLLNGHLGYRMRMTPQWFEVQQDPGFTHNGYYSQQDEQIEHTREEARILYVAMTRTKHAFTYFYLPTNGNLLTWQKLLEAGGN